MITTSSTSGPPVCRAVGLSLWTVCLAGSLAAVGCDQGSGPTGGAATDDPPLTATLPDGVMVDQPPADPQPVADLKLTAKEGDDVVIRVVVGGRVEPIVRRRAVMTVVDAGLENVCLQPDDNCRTPWDYCCSSREELEKNMATVQLANEAGQPLALNLTQSASVKPQTTLVVQGTVGARPDPSVLVVNASRIHIEKQAP